MSPAKQTLREEFEKARSDGYKTSSDTHWDSAFLAGARWMAERIILDVKEYDPTNLEKDIRKMIEELQ